MQSKLQHSEKLVRRGLELSDAARQSDKQLLINIWQLCGMRLTAAQISQFYLIPSPESLTRMRRKLQENGEYLPPENITKERHEQAAILKQEVMRWHS